MKNSLFQKQRSWIAATWILLLLLALSFVVAVTFGTVQLSVREVYETILDGPFAEQSAVRNVVWFIRLPRLVLAAAVGMGLSICGVIMQAIVKNPLADPYVLGVSSGASLGATSSVLLGVGMIFGGNAMGIMGFLGAFAASAAVLLLANVGTRSSSVKLLLAGTAVSAVCSAFSNFLIFVSNKSEAVRTLVNWTMGSLAGADWVSNGIIWLVILGGTLFFWTQYRTLNLMLLGDESAITLGTDMHKWRILYLIISSLMVGFSVYKAGMIGFVGLVVPHAVRMVFGTDHKKLIPIAALAGAIFLIWADVFCRILIPDTEMPIGILTAFVGAPVFIYLMARKKYGFGGGD